MASPRHTSAACQAPNGASYIQARGESTGGRTAARGVVIRGCDGNCPQQAGRRWGSGGRAKGGGGLSPVGQFGHELQAQLTGLALQFLETRAMLDPGLASEGVMLAPELAGARVQQLEALFQPQQHLAGLAAQIFQPGGQAVFQTASLFLEAGHLHGPACGVP